MLVDRAVPRLEFLWMPETIQPGGTLGLRRNGMAVSPERRKGWKKHAHRIIRKDPGLDAIHGPVLDLRMNFPENWAHAQIFHLPLASYAREWLGVSPTLLVTHATPKYIRALLKHFGFSVVATDREVRGDLVIPEVSSFDVLRPARRELVLPLVVELDRRRTAGEFATELPTKIFVVRKKTRRIRNDAEISHYLEGLGYVKIYPETLSVPLQIELFNRATDIVAIHGAALAPLLFRSPQAPRFRLLEILTPGHMATSYRLMASQIGGDYVGVRGRIEPEHVRGAYDFTTVYKAYSLNDFEVDLESVKAALTILATGTPPRTVV
jgi:capsular polysaccharide biosynthesis protein